MKNQQIKINWSLVVKIFLTMIFLPFVAIWYVWEKTNWPNRNKWIATVAILFFVFIVVASDSNNKTNQTKELESRVATLENQLNQEKQKNAPPQLEVEAQPVKEISETDKLYDVLNVTDGDTLKVNVDGKIETVRLIGIDTPEIVDPRKPVQCFGKESSDKAKEILVGKKIKLESDSTQGDRDQYERILRYIILEDGTSFNKKMIEDGYAHEYTYQSNPYKYQTEFKNAEKSARENKRGLWAVDTCNGDTEKAASSVASSNASLNVNTSLISKELNNESTQISESGVVKKSSTGICHAPGTTYYAKTKNYISFNSIQSCLDSGGRLPKR